MRRYVLWPRIDQKTCLKAITSAGLLAVPLPLAQSGDQLGTDLPALAAEMARLGADAVVCVVSTTSCFAPRGADSLVEVAKLCTREGVGHVVNNAYGVQSAQLCALVRLHFCFLFGHLGMPCCCLPS
jgi:O-phospho-L-seryl-tRNASec:L-selenocysteinyl-tRNA synthase